MKHIFLDTNILVDLSIRRRPESDPSIRLLRACQQGTLQGYTTTWSLMTLMYLMDAARDEHGRRMCTKAEVVSEATALLTFLHLVDSNSAAMAGGLALGWPDWEDAILYRLADSHPQIEAIVTNDDKFRKRTKALPGIRAVAPADVMPANG